MSSLLRGSCLCGAVRYTVSSPVAFAEHCHCSMCRKAHGAAFSTNAAVPAASVSIVGSENLSQYASSKNRLKMFCARCGSQLFIKRTNAPEVMVVTLGTLDQDPGIKPSRHVFVGSKAPWFEIEASLSQHEVYP
jgi:hypothetical protein